MQNIAKFSLFVTFYKDFQNCMYNPTNDSAKIAISKRGPMELVFNGVVVVRYLQEK